MFRQSGVEIWDPREKRLLKLGSEVKRFTATVRFDMNARVRFAAKVALGAGYLLYGDFFRYYVKHKDLCLLMSHGVSRNLLAAGDVTLRLYDQFSEVSDEDRAKLVVIREIYRSTSASGVIFGHGPSNLVVIVGVLGQYLASLNVEADMEVLDLSAEFDWGQVVFIQGGQLHHASLRQAIALLAEKFGVKTLPEYD